MLVGQKLYRRYEQDLFKVSREMAQKQIESEICYYLKNETLTFTFGATDTVKMGKVVFSIDN